MKQLFISTLVLSLFGLALSAPSQNDAIAPSTAPPPNPLSNPGGYEYYDDVKAISEAQNSFTRDIYLDMVNNLGGNIFFSPFSISTCLAMVHLGSQGNTETELRSTFHFPANKTSIRRGYKDLITDIQQNRSEYTLKSSNMAYIDDGFRVLDEFKNQVENDFKSEVNTVDFAQSEAVRNQINSDVEEKTENKIKDLLPPNSLDIDTTMVLVNTIYFNGTWQHKFQKSKTHNRTFHLNNSSHVQTEFMSVKARLKIGYPSNLNATVLSLPYKGYDVDFLIVLPNEVEGLAEVESQLTSFDLTSLRSSLQVNTVDVKIPKFKMEPPRYNLKEHLKRLGINDAFSGNADFSSISNRAIYVTDAFHKAFIEVDESGTEAAAATAVVTVSRSHLRPLPVKTFIADHPFLFFITHKNSDAILFAGRYVQPPAQGHN